MYWTCSGSDGLVLLRLERDGSCSLQPLPRVYHPVLTEPMAQQHMHPQARAQTGWAPARLTRHNNHKAMLRLSAFHSTPLMKAAW